MFVYCQFIHQSNSYNIGDSVLMEDFNNATFLDLQLRFQTHVEHAVNVSEGGICILYQ